MNLGSQFSPDVLGLGCYKLGIGDSPGLTQNHDAIAN